MKKVKKMATDAKVATFVESCTAGLPILEAVVNEQYGCSGWFLIGKVKVAGYGYNYVSSRDEARKYTVTTVESLYKCKGKPLYMTEAEAREGALEITRRVIAKLTEREVTYR